MVAGRRDPNDLLGPLHSLIMLWLMYDHHCLHIMITILYTYSYCFIKRNGKLYFHINFCYFYVNSAEIIRIDTKITLPKEIYFFKKKYTRSFLVMGTIFASHFLVDFFFFF